MTTTDETRTVNIIRNTVFTVICRRRCVLCGGLSEKSSFGFELRFDLIDADLREDSNGGDVCLDCAEHPELVPARAREWAAELRRHAECLEAIALEQFETDVVAGPEIDAAYEYYPGYRLEDEFPTWMRRHLGLPDEPPREP
jgi:2-iminoacetate synthase ThiH